MGYDRNRVRGALVPQVICGICDLVLEDALQVSLPGCQHVFCRKCIDTRLASEATCPLDGEQLTSSDLTEEPFLINFFLDILEIACDFASLGCEAFVKLTELSDHVEDCSYRSQLRKKCEANCGAVLKRDSLFADFPEHCCVTYLLEVNESLRKECEEAKKRETRCSQTMSTQKAEIILLKKQVDSLKSQETRRVSTRTAKDVFPQTTPCTVTIERCLEPEVKARPRPRGRPKGVKNKTTQKEMFHDWSGETTEEKEEEDEEFVEERPVAKRPVADFLMEPKAQESGGRVLLAIEGTPPKVMLNKFLYPKPKGGSRPRGRPKGVKNRRKLEEMFQGSSNDETTEEEEPEEEEEEEDEDFVDDEDDLDYVPVNKLPPKKRKAPPHVVQTKSIMKTAKKAPPPAVQMCLQITSNTKKVETRGRKPKVRFGPPEFICPHVECRKVFYDPDTYRGHVKSHPAGQLAASYGKRIGLSPVYLMIPDKDSPLKDNAKC